MPNDKPSELRFRAAMEPDSMDADKRTVDVTWTTGARVRRSNWRDGEYDEELSMDPSSVRMDRLNSGAPFLANHDAGDLDNVIGVVESARMENGRGVARVRFAKDDPHAESVFNKVKQGVVRNISVGYRVHKMEKMEGGEGKTPVYRATDWEPYELSAVPIPADAGASFRSLSLGNLPQKEHHQMDPKSPEQVAAEKAAEDQKIKAAVEAERARASEIRLAARSGKFSEEETQGLIDSGKAADEVRKLVIERMAKADDDRPVVAQHEAASGITVGREARERFFKSALASMIVRYGMADRVVAMQKNGPEHLKRFFNDVDLKEADSKLVRARQAYFAREALEIGGLNVRRMDDHEIIGRALDMQNLPDRLLHRSGGENTTSDYSLLLENLMHKELLSNFALADDTWSKFCGVDTVNDFRNANRYHTGSFGTLPLLPEGEEYTFASVPDGAKYVVSAQSYGRMTKVSRQALVNDDIAGILDTMGKEGRSAALSIEVAVYAALAKNSGLGPSVTYNGNTANLFDSSWGNVGTGAALSVQSIDADRTLMGYQKDISGNEYIDLITPQTLVLLVPLTLRGQALNINKSEWDVSQSNKFQVPNIVQGLFREVVASPRLASNSTRRYMFHQRGSEGALVVAFLNGERAPFMESRLGWRIDGTEMKIRMDYGVQAANPQLALTNAGA